MTKKWTDYSDNEIFGLMIGVFLGFGLAIDAALDSVGAGIAIGMGLAVAAAEGVKAKKRRRHDDQ